jgi:hypothetical protein
MEVSTTVPLPLNPLAAHAWWLTLSSPNTVDNVANYHTIAGNGCLDGRIYKSGTGATARFKYKESSNIILQLDCDDLAVVLKDIIRKAKHFIMDAREALICEKSVGFGFIKKGQYFGKVMSSLGRMTADELMTNIEKVAELTKTERFFVREECAAFCEKENLNVVTTHENAGWKQGKLIELAQPQRNWSGNALYAKSMEVTKEVHKKITEATKKGKAKAYVQKRMRKMVECRDESSGERAKKRQKSVNGNIIPIREEIEVGEELLQAAIKSNNGVLSHFSLHSLC